MLRFKLNNILIHVTGWLLFLVLPVLFLSTGSKQSGAWILLSSPYYWLFCLTYLILFYFNLWYLIPSFFLKKKRWVYGLFVIILLSFVWFLQPFDKLLVHNPRFHEQMEAIARQQAADSLKAITSHNADSIVNGPGDKSLPFGPLPHQDLRMQLPEAKSAPVGSIWQHSSNIDIVSLFLFGIIIALGLSIRTVEQWQTTEQKVIKAEAEKVNAELSFLKAQINPHFLFNTLNNIYTLSLMNSEHTSESIMKLSNIMRYVTDDVTQDFVPLQQDLDCIKNYVDLQKLRLGRKTIVNFEVDGEVTNQKIAPLILMSFVENTFKYGVSKQTDSIIGIKISVKSDAVTFECENAVFERPSNLPDRTGGIGIANTKQRLSHLYPKKHTLNIQEADGIFKVKLILSS
jgi:two-component system LytT family sensor kinase